MRRLIAGSLVLLVGCVSFLLARSSADAVMEDFDRAQDRAEDMLMDPLILHARVVRQTVIRKVSDPAMPKRRYAIGFLGIDGHAEALPVLRRILRDEAEIDYFRADALSAIWQIRKEEALQLAPAFSSQSGLLGRFAAEIVAGTHEPFRRSYWEALVGVHE